ncbi:MAG: thiamine-binding protein [Patescibacteria group bacterium]
MYNSSISFQVLPKVKSDKQMIKIIDRVIKMIKESGVNYEVGPMETTMEGDLETLFQIVKKAQYLCVKEGALNVFTNVKIIYNPKGVMTIEQKVKKHRLK